MQPVERTFGNDCDELGIDYTLRKENLLQIVPLKWSLKTMLEMPGSFDLLKTHMRELAIEKNIISNITQGQLWKKNYAHIQFKLNELLVPLMAFENEFETGNAFGSHAGDQTFTAMYMRRWVKKQPNPG